MSNDDLELEVRKSVAEMVGLPLRKIITTTDVVEDTRIYGDDVFELVDGFAKRFHVDIASFRWYHHTGPECVGLLTQIRSLFSKPWWARKTYIPIRVSDLVESATRGARIIQYPEHGSSCDASNSIPPSQWLHWHVVKCSIVVWQSIATSTPESTTLGHHSRTSAVPPPAHHL